MSASLSMGPMLLMESRQGNSMLYRHMQQPGPPLPVSAFQNSSQSHNNGLIQQQTAAPQVHQHQNQQIMHTQQAAPSGQHIVSASMNRSQRCGVCRGCQCKPCGQCTYCQDSPQFGGPGVKKQSCIERRCLRVLENRLQRDAPTFKARVGCNHCEDCRMPDCQICLVCLDKRFFDNRYMTGAMCAKKRCNNATSLELPAAQNAAELRLGQKRVYDQSGMVDYQILKRRAHSSIEQLTSTQQHILNLPAQAILNGPGCTIPPGASGLYLNQQMRLVPPLQGITPQQLLLAHHHHQQQHPGTTTIVPCSTATRNTERVSVSSTAQCLGNSCTLPITINGTNSDTQVIAAHSQQYTSHLPPQQFPRPYLIAGAVAAGDIGTFLPSYIEENPVALQSDPFTPPSYAPEMKNVVVLQPL
ncbi:unnamed protein product [Thelazia callipaeda]|uniref:CXXC-type domain-containing protein n=1 Tax=Thelazia callipaeda TaxID=103827 RepID=A0A0N5D147_THECL|nr:unnamed protein product [Thelazia callipaeda]